MEIRLKFDMDVRRKINPVNMTIDLRLNLLN